MLVSRSSAGCAALVAAASKGLPPSAKNLAVAGEQRRTTYETRQPVWGTRKEIRNRANELVLSLQETEANLTDWAGMHFTGVAGAPNAVMKLLGNLGDDD